MAFEQRRAQLRERERHDRTVAPAAQVGSSAARRSSSNASAPYVSPGHARGFEPQREAVTASAGTVLPEARVVGRHLHRSRCRPARRRIVRRRGTAAEPRNMRRSARWDRAGEVRAFGACRPVPDGDVHRHRGGVGASTTRSPFFSVTVVGALAADARGAPVATHSTRQAAANTARPRRFMPGGSFGVECCLEGISGWRRGGGAVARGPRRKRCTARTRARRRPTARSPRRRASAVRSMRGHEAAVRVVHADAPRRGGRVRGEREGEHERPAVRVHRVRAGQPQREAAGPIVSGTFTTPLPQQQRRGCSGCRSR